MSKADKAHGKEVSFIDLVTEIRKVRASLLTEKRRAESAEKERDEARKIIERIKPATLDRNFYSLSIERLCADAQQFLSALNEKGEKERCNTCGNTGPKVVNGECHPDCNFN